MALPRLPPVVNFLLIALIIVLCGASANATVGWRICSVSPDRHEVPLRETGGENLGSRWDSGTGPLR